MDRNVRIMIVSSGLKPSLSARRAWIEIIMFVNLRVVDGVALRKESVDRNLCSIGKYGSQAGSLSARRAWIEMCVRGHSQFLHW